jgi:hypothetical protein
MAPGIGDTGGTPQSQALDDATAPSVSSGIASLPTNTDVLLADNTIGGNSITDFLDTAVKQRILEQTQPEYSGYANIDDIIAAQKKDTRANAMIQLGAGIMEDDLSGGLTRAGAAGMRGKQISRYLELQDRQRKAAFEAKNLTATQQATKDLQLRGDFESMISHLPPPQKNYLLKLYDIDQTKAMEKASPLFMAGENEYDPYQGDTTWDTLVARAEGEGRNISDPNVIADLGKKWDALKKSDPATATKIDRRINHLVRTKHMSPDDAERQVLFHEMELDQFGNMILTDEADQTSSYVVTENPDQSETPAPATGDTLYEQAQYAFGPSNFVIEGLGKVADWFPGGTLPTESEVRVRAQQKFNTNINNLTRALKQTRAFAEQKWIIDELNALPSAFTGEGTGMARLDELANTLKLMLEQSERDAKNFQIGKEAQNEAARKAAILRNFIPVLGSAGGDQNMQDYQKARELLMGNDGP